MAVLFIVSLFLLFSLPQETNAVAGDVNDACKTGGICTDATNTVCDTVANKCLYKATKTCTANIGYCVTGATCATTSSLCVCGATYIAASTGLCGLRAGQACSTTTAPCLDNGQCSSSTCTCKTGYTPSADKTVCKLMVDQACSNGGTPCLDNGECLSSACKCKTGYTPSTDKATCIADDTYGGACTITSTVDSCVTLGGDVNAVCKDSKCACKSGYTGSIGAKCSGAASLASSLVILIAAIFVKTHLE